MKEVLFFFHEFYMIALFVRKYLYLYELSKMDVIATNSIENQKWLTTWTKRTDIQVIYPPVNMLRFRPVREKIPFTIQEHNNVESIIEREVPNYYVSFARLTQSKSIDKVIHAFQHMPEKNLIILYSPYDPDLERLMKMAV